MQSFRLRHSFPSKTGSCSATGRGALASTLSRVRSTAAASTSMSSDGVFTGAIKPQVAFIGEPGDGCFKSPPEPIAAGVCGLPADQALGLRVVGPKPLNLACLRAQAPALGFHRNPRVHDFRNDAYRIADGDLKIAADIDDLSDRGVGFRRGDECAYGVLDVVEVPGRVQGAEANR